MAVAHRWTSIFGTSIVIAAASSSPVRAEDDGEVLFNTHCRNCHSVQAGDNRLGPSLHGVVGREAGKAQGFNAYSGALKGFTWDRATLDKFIAEPAAVAPNTTMIFPPVKDSGQRQKIIDFLEKSKG